MKRFAGHLTAAAFALGALLGAEGAIAGIANTKHNLGSTGAIVGQNKVSAADTDEICVFCHTPHGADTTAPAPLWNKRLATGATYTTYAASSTMNAQFATDGIAGSPSIGSVSLACLSCHDGTQAMDNVINAPGSGGYDVTGGGTNGRAWTWSGGGVNAAGMLTSVANLGADLSNDHPIGIQYCGGGPMVSAPAAACNDADFRAPTSATIGSQLVFWVDTGTPGTRQKNDLTLFNRTFAAGAGPSVECATCHDPHVESGTGTPAAGATFLRIANTGSAVCLACHVK